MSSSLLLLLITGRGEGWWWGGTHQISADNGTLSWTGCPPPLRRCSVCSSKRPSRSTRGGLTVITLGLRFVRVVFFIPDHLIRLFALRALLPPLSSPSSSSLRVCCSAGTEGSSPAVNVTVREGWWGRGRGGGLVVGPWPFIPPWSPERACMDRASHP